MKPEPETSNPGEIRAIDHNAFAGSWPFRYLGEAATPASVEKKLGTAGIASAWISPLDALFNAVPYTANEWLIASTAESKLLQAVPVFNPRLAGAAKEMEELLKQHPKIPAIRLASGYHGYDLDGPEVRGFIGKIPAEKTVVITLRVQDRRGQHPLFQVKDAPLEAAFTLTAAFPEKHFLLCGIRLGEVTSARDKWNRYPNLHIETSFIDGVTGIADCADIVGNRRLHLGTLAPLLYASASVEKIRRSGLTSDRIQQILAPTL